MLALETTTAMCSVALQVDGGVVESSRVVPRSHNDHVLKMIDGLFASIKIHRLNIDCVAFSAGPGSFTGVRIAAAAAQAIALAADCQVCPVPSAMVLLECYRGFIPHPGEVQIVRQSRRDLHYSAHVVVNEDNECRIKDERLVAEPLPDYPRQVVRDSHIHVSASNVITRALRMQSEWVDPQHALPLYVEGDTPWKPRN